MVASTASLNKHSFSQTRAGQATGKLSVIDELAKMPANTQLLVSYCLEKNCNRLSLLSGDPDAQPLVDVDWLRPLVSQTVGVRDYVFKPAVWAQLRMCKQAILQAQPLEKREAYRRGKSALYPWVW
jgi:hypothetical protein